MSLHFEENTDTYEETSSSNQTIPVRPSTRELPCSIPYGTTPPTVSIFESMVRQKTDNEQKEGLAEESKGQREAVVVEEEEEEEGEEDDGKETAFFEMDEDPVQDNK